MCNFYIYIDICVYMHMHAGALEGKKRAQISKKKRPELKKEGGHGRG